MKRPAPRNEPSPLRRVRLPGTVQLLQPTVSRRDEAEQQKREPAGTDTTRRAGG